MCVSVSVPINSIEQGCRCQSWGEMRSLTLSLSPSHTYRVEADSTRESRCSRGGVQVGVGAERRGKGVEVEDRASSGASNSIVTDLLPI